MIWFVSDPHGGEDISGLEKFAAESGKDDLLIILGDLELNFRDTEANKNFSNYFHNLKCNIAFIDGNHENFEYLYSLPEEEWCGGRIHRISENIIHLMRGYVFNIEGKTFLTMGGCKSSQKWMDWGLWWKEEIPNIEEIKRGYENLKKHNNKVDYVLTHKFRPEEFSEDRMVLEGFCKFVEENVEFKHWYSGHWHKELSPDDKHTVVFDNLIKLKEID